MSTSPFSCCPVNRECVWKKTLIEKKAGSSSRCLKLYNDELRDFTDKTKSLRKKWIFLLKSDTHLPLKLSYNRNKLFKTLHYSSRDTLNFDFLGKSLGIVSPAHSVYAFSTKMFLMLYFINWPKFIAWFPLLLENWVICVLQLFVNQVATSWILKLILSF